MTLLPLLVEYGLSPQEGAELAATLREQLGHEGPGN